MKRIQIALSDAPALEEPRALRGELGRDVERRSVVVGLEIHPRHERRGREAREREEQIGQIALHVDHEHRHARAERLFDEHRHEARLAAAGHADDDAVGDEVMGGQEQGSRRGGSAERLRRAETGSPDGSP